MDDVLSLFSSNTNTSGADGILARLGPVLQGKLGTEVGLDAAPDRRFAATFREATGQADSSTQTFEGHFRFSPPSDLVVLTGML